MKNFLEKVLPIVILVVSLIAFVIVFGPKTKMTPSVKAGVSQKTTRSSLQNDPWDGSGKKASKEDGEDASYSHKKKHKKR